MRLSSWRWTALLGIALVANPQSRPFIAGASARQPFDTVMPGQLITIFAAAPGMRLDREVQPSGTTLVNSLEGVVVEVIQFGNWLPLPIQSIRPYTNCEKIVPLPGVLEECPAGIAIIAQVPYELESPLPVHSSVVAPCKLLSLRVNESPRSYFSVCTPIDQPAVLGRACRSGVAGCPPEVLRASDGRVVDFDRPAREGDLLSLYVVGLGPTDPPLKTGVPNPSGSLPALRFPPEVILEFGLNASPRRRLFMFSSSPSLVKIEPLYLGPAPSLIGTFQVNLRLPKPPTGLPRCDGPNTTNATISIVGYSAGDGVSFCVDP